MVDALLGLATLVGLALSLWCSARLRARQRRSCSHTRYRGGAGVACLTCRRERERIAGHLQRVTGGRG